MNNGSLYNILGNKDKQGLLKLNLANATKRPLFQLSDKIKPLKSSIPKLTVSNNRVVKTNYKSPIIEKVVPYITPMTKVKQLEQEIRKLKQVLYNFHNRNFWIGINFYRKRMGLLNKWKRK
jgi:hypothetical protein